MTLRVQQINLLKIPLANISRYGPKLVHMCRSRGDNVQEILGAIGKVGENWGLGRLLRSRSFFVTNTRRLFGNFPMADFHQIRPWNVNLCPIEGICKNFRFFYFRSHFPPKTSLLQGVKQAPHSHLIIEGGQRGTSLTPAQGTHCREMLITPHCRPNSREFPRSDNLLYNVWFRSYGPTKVPNFRIFAYFSYTKRLKIPFCVRSTAQGLHRRMLLVIPCSSRRPKGVLFASVVFLQLMVGELETLKNAQILAYGKCLNIYTVLLHGASDWTKDGWKRVIVSKDVPFGGLNYATTHCFSRWTLLC